VFDIDRIDFNDPVEAMEEEHHTEVHFYPMFTITNCESCHNAGTYNVPDQSKSLPGKLSGAESHATLAENGFDRNIGDVPAYVTGPASRACGSCHRAVMINEDNAGELTAFNAHTKAFGYLEVDEDDVFDTVVSAIMAIYE